MDEKPPDSQVPQENLQKLEEDLNSLKIEEAKESPGLPPQEQVQAPAAAVISDPAQPPTLETPPKKSNKILWFAVALLFLSIAGAVGYLAVGRGLFSKKTVYCTQEVMVCPDGTGVGRTGPNCEFAPCPAPSLIPKITPEISPFETPSATPSATSSATPTAFPSVSPRP